MSAIAQASICLSDIPREAITTSKKNGKKYLNLSIFINDETSQHGTNVGIAVGQTQEQREAKEPKVYLGNGKVVYVNGSVEVAAKQGQTQAAQNSADDDQDFPF